MMQASFDAIGERHGLLVSDYLVERAAQLVISRI